MKRSWVVLSLGLWACSGGTTFDDGGSDGASEADLTMSGDLAIAGMDLGPTCVSCTSYVAQTSLGANAEAALTETSGLAASRTHASVLYAHNDSGGGSKFYALSTAGVALGTFTITNATLVDPEDIDVGPCPAGNCVFVGDIGDNNHVYATRSVYRIAEPNVAVGAPVGAVNVTAERFQYTYPGDTMHNAETLLVHPTTGDIYVVTKEAAGVVSQVFKFPQPLNATSTVTLLAVTTLAIPLPSDSDISGGDISPCGDALLLRTNDKAYQFNLGQGAAFDTIFSAAYVARTIASETNGESIAWSPDGRGYYSTSEGTAEQIHFRGCAP